MSVLTFISLLTFNSKLRPSNFVNEPISIRKVFYKKLSTNKCGSELRKGVKPFEEIPGVKSLPLIGTGWSFLPIVGKYKFSKLPEATMKKYLEYGPLVRDDILNRKAVWMFDPDDIRTVFRSEGKEPVRVGLDSLRIFRSMNTQIYGDGGILVNSGSTWSQLRFKAQPALLKVNALNDYLPNICMAAEEMVTKLGQINNNNHNHIQVDIFYRWALESLGAVLLNTKFGCLNAKDDNSDTIQLIKAISDMLEYNYKLDFDPLPIWRWINKPFGQRWKKYIQSNEKFTQIAIKYIQIAMKNKTEESIIGKLLCRPDFNEKDAISLLLDLIMAGVDSTSHAVVFNLFHLSKNIKCQESLYAEISSIIPSSQHSLNANDLHKLNYLRACMKETHRLMPIVVGTNRVLRQDIVCKGFHIPKGTLIIPTHYVPCRLNKYFSEPLVYSPERWIRDVCKYRNSRIRCKNDSHPFLVLPFGFGPRTCIGKRLAELEIMVLLIKVILKYRVEYDGDEDQLQMVTKFINVPVGPLKFKFIPRL